MTSFLILLSPFFSYMCPSVIQKSEASKANEWSPAEGRREPFRRKNKIGIISATRKRKPVFLELRGAATPRRLISPPGPTGQFWDSHKYNIYFFILKLFCLCISLKKYNCSHAFNRKARQAKPMSGVPRRAVGSHFDGKI